MWDRAAHRPCSCPWPCPTLTLTPTLTPTLILNARSRGGIDEAAALWLHKHLVALGHAANAHTCHFMNPSPNPDPDPDPNPDPNPNPNPNPNPDPNPNQV